MKVRPTKKLVAQYDRATRKRVVNMQARRLASADFYYGMNPDRTAVVCRIEPKAAVKLRKSIPYKETFDELELEMKSTLKKDMQMESDRLKMAMADLVPDAIERLRTALDDDGLIGLQASREILDRDGRMPKVSRVQSTIEDKTGLPDVDDAILREFSGEAAKPN